MKRLSAIIVLAVATVASWGQTKTYTLNIGDFDELTVVNSINVSYCMDPDKAGTAVYTCSPEIASYITFTNDKDRLKIEVITPKNTLPVAGLPCVKVYSSSLEKAQNWADSTLTVENNQPAQVFKAKVIGNGNLVARNIHATRVEGAVEAGNGHVYLQGKARNGKFNIVSAGAIEAGDLETVKASCRVFGSGAIDCNVSEDLSAFGAGSGKVYYRGTPKIKNRTVGIKLISVDNPE